MKLWAILQLFNHVFHEFVIFVAKYEWNWIKPFGFHPDMQRFKMSRANEGSATPTVQQRHLLRHQREGFGTYSRTRHQLDHHMFGGSLEMRPCDLFKHRGQGGHIASFCAGISACCVQDVSSVHHKQQHMGLTFSLQGVWKRDVLKKGLKGRGNKNKGSISWKEWVLFLAAGEQRLLYNGPTSMSSAPSMLLWGAQRGPPSWYRPSVLDE